MYDIILENELNHKLILGSCQIYKYPELIKDLNIKTIICIKDYGFKLDQVKNYINLNISHKNFFKINIMTYYIHKMNKYIDEKLKEGNIYIHCRSGVNRSPIFVMAYLIYKYGISTIDAYDYVKKRRYEIKPTYYKTFKKIYYIL